MCSKEVLVEIKYLIFTAHAIILCSIRLDFIFFLIQSVLSRTISLFIDALIPVDQSQCILTSSRLKREPVGARSGWEKNAQEGPWL